MRTNRLLLLLAGLAAAFLLLGGCGDDSDAPGDADAEQESAETIEGAEAGEGSEGEGAEAGRGTARAPESAGDERPDAPDDAIGDRPGGGGDEDPGPPVREPSRGQEQQIERAVRAYLAALARGDGKRLCRSTFVPGALKRVSLPAREGSCARSVSASIGSPAQRGSARWLGASLIDARTAILVDGGDGRMTATVANRLAGSERRWVEDDVIYLRRHNLEGRGSRWLIVKPSATFYRAIGYADVPLTALTPP